MVLVLFSATIIAAFRKTGGVTLRMIVKTAQMKQDVHRALVRALNLGEFNRKYTRCLWVGAWWCSS